MARVTQWLSVSRLLTLTGPGGCGKTRLALEVAAGMREHFAHGVWHVELAALADQALVPEVVASTLGIHKYPERSLIATLLEYFQHRELLLILDNCEHVVTACAQFAADLLGSCPQLCILATSREALSIAGEIILSVSPLTFPDPHELHELGCTLSIEQLKHYEAIQLFLERASLALPTFTLTEQNAPAIVRLCQRLDGIPLAIELAAAHVRVLSVEQIAARLEKNCCLPGGGIRTVLPRQQTLEATMDWSYALLTSAEQSLFQKLSVFAGSFTLEAAEAICGTGGLEPGEVAGLLFNLVNKSLLVVEHQGGEARYRLLETFKRYGQEKLCSVGEITELSQRHRDWYLTFAEQAASALFGAERQVWLERLEREHDNLRAALRWMLEQGNYEHAQALPGAGLALAAWAEGQAMPLEQAIDCTNTGQTAAHETVTRLAQEQLPLPELRIFALGIAQVYRGERALTPSDWTYIKGRELLYYLLCHHPRTREQIGLALWPDVSPAQLRSNLRATLYHLRRALGRSDWILFDGEHYAFNFSLPYWFDVEAFESAFAEVQQAPAKPPLQDVLSWEKAFSLYRGDFLEDVEVGDWYVLQREALRRRYLEALLIVGRARFAHEHYIRAAHAFLQLISNDSLNETAHRELMRCYARMGERGRAVQHYHALFAQVRAEFGSLPDPATTDLYERLRRGEQV